jgi:predicted ATPase
VLDGYEGLGLDLLGTILELPSELPEELSGADDQREALVTLLLRHITAFAQSKPTLCIVEDVHWADPSTLEAINRIVGELGKQSVMLVLTYRPEFQHSWAGQAHSSSLQLSRLGTRDTASLVSSVAGRYGLSAAVIETIVERADGVPLFIEELTRTVLEQDSADVVAHEAIPMTLQDSLMERLDRLGRAKQVAQAAAVIGRDFTQGQVSAIFEEADAEDIATALQALEGAGLVFRRADVGGDRLAFKHALVRDAAHQSLLGARRQRYCCLLPEACAWSNNSMRRSRRCTARNVWPSRARMLNS